MAIADLPPPSLELNEEQVTQFSERWQVTIDQAVERLRWQQLLPGFDPAIRVPLGRSFGGIWIDNENDNRVTVGVVGEVESLSSIVLNVADQWSLRQAVVIAAVRFPYEDLLREGEWLRKQRALVLPRPVRPIETGLDIPANRLHIRFENDNLLASESVFLDSARERLGEMLIVDFGAVDVVPAACASPYCDPPLRGGVGIDGNVTCTAGFMAGSNKLYTAGHCVQAGGAGSWSSKDSSGVSANIGTGASGWNHQPYDYGLIDVANSSYWGSEGLIWVSANAENPIYNRSVSHTGDSVCVTGRMTGTLCGTVVAIGQDFGCSGGTCNYQDFGKTDTCQIPGDSGGPVYNLNTARGMVGTVADPQGSPCLMYFQGIRRAVTAMGVELLYETP